jgi:maltooligosyltrehalose trehalohydrolase
MTHAVDQGRGLRRFAVGAEPSARGTHFRVWAPKCSALDVILVDGSGSVPRRVPLDREPEGYFSGLVAGARPGDRYRFATADGAFPDPASRFQPDGPDGPSEIIDPTRFPWTDASWSGLGPDGQVLYEMHVGTWTPDGTWRAAIAELPALASLGITAIELMPVADFAGTFGWGYDGVDLYAPTRLYGTPDEFRAFIDRAHALGLGVLLDVVYNHLGPAGCYLSKFSDHYFSRRYDNEWGDPLNFDDERSGPVREFVTENAAYWIQEFHLDGLRLDATQSMVDASPRHIVRDVVARAREAAGARRVYVVAENEPQEARLVRAPADGGLGLDAVWNDDFHHAALVALTGRREAYYTDYGGSAQEFVSAARRGFLYQGQRYSWQQKGRGEPTRGLPPKAFVHFLENHDQVANSARGQRLHQKASPGAWRAMTALLLLGPNTPMLFQGQEFGSTAPFHYFADHAPPLGDTVRTGRHEFLAQFPSINDPAARRGLAAPGDRPTFTGSVLDLGQRERHGAHAALHRDLIALRRSDPAIEAAGRGELDGAVLGEGIFVLRYFAGAHGDRLLIVNLGPDYRPAILSEPLLAPPAGSLWVLAWSSEDPAYGGEGTPGFNPDVAWHVAGRSAMYLRSIPRTERSS